jgi:hypothetical protein
VSYSACVPPAVRWLWPGARGPRASHPRGRAGLAPLVHDGHDLRLRYPRALREGSKLADGSTASCGCRRPGPYVRQAARMIVDRGLGGLAQRRGITQVRCRMGPLHSPPFQFANRPWNSGLPMKPWFGVPGPKIWIRVL